MKNSTISISHHKVVSREELSDLSGDSAFFKDETGQIFHTYSTFGRGGEEFLGFERQAQPSFPFNPSPPRPSLPDTEARLTYNFPLAQIAAHQLTNDRENERDDKKNDIRRTAHSRSQYWRLELCSWK